MGTTFQRWLSRAAFEEAKRVADLLQTWNGNAGRAPFRDRAPSPLGGSSALSASSLPSENW